MPGSQADLKPFRRFSDSRSWQMTKNLTRQRGYLNLLSNNNNFYYLKQIRCLPIQTFIIQTVVTQHHLIRRYARVTFATVASYLELGPPVIAGVSKTPTWGGGRGRDRSRGRVGVGVDVSLFAIYLEIDSIFLKKYLSVCNGKSFKQIIQQIENVTSFLGMRL